MEFFDLLLFAYIGWCAVETFLGIYYEARHGETVQTIADSIESTYGESVRSYAAKRNVGFVPPVWASVVVAAILLIPDGPQFDNIFFYIMVCLVGAGTYFAPFNRYVGKQITTVEAQRRIARQQEQTARKFQQRASFEAPPESDDAFFSSKAQQQRARERPWQEHKPSPKQETPYGFDKRHPKDAKLWAVVDDPNASDGERQAAFSAILKRNAQRKRGEDPNPASDADVTRLIGSDRK